MFDLEFALSADGTGHLDALECGLRFFFPMPGIPGAPFTSLNYRIFDLGVPTKGATASTVKLHAMIDPMRPLDPARTEFTFAAGAPTLGSFYRTNLSAPMVLCPVDAPAPARLVFALRPRSGQPGVGDPMYLVPDGSFTLDMQAIGQKPQQSNFLGSIRAC